jgi:hypothetical protein
VSTTSPESREYPESRDAAIRALLALRAGENASAQSVAVAAEEIWRDVAARLAPVIGARGVNVIVRRALHQTSGNFPWLEIGGDHEAGVAALARIKTRLAEQDAAHAAAASHALLAKFTELLAILIGESLTERLLGPVWAAPPLVPQQETGK